MVRRQAVTLGVLGAVVLFGTLGCQYPISRQYREVAKRDVTIPMVQAEPQAYNGDIVIWGGKILQTTNQAGMTEIVVLASPLDSGEEPLGDAYADGRFIARADRFLDPEVYARGRKVTLAGEVTGIERRAVGGASYAYPVVQIKQIYAWTAYGSYGGAYYPGYYYGPYGWPYYWWGPGYGYDGAYFEGDLYLRGGGGREGHEGGHERGR